MKKRIEMAIGSSVDVNVSDSRGDEGRVKLTKQGVRDLTPRNFNGHKARPCRHFYGPPVVVGVEFAFGDDCMGYYEREVYGRRCMHCDSIVSLR